MSSLSALLPALDSTAMKSARSNAGSGPKSGRKRSIMYENSPSRSIVGQDGKSDVFITPPSSTRSPSILISNMLEEGEADHGRKPKGGFSRSNTSIDLNGKGKSRKPAGKLGVPSNPKRSASVVSSAPNDSAEVDDEVLPDFDDDTKASGYVYLKHRAEVHYKANRAEITQRKKNQVQTLLDKVAVHVLTPAGLQMKKDWESRGNPALKGRFEDDIQAMMEADRSNFELPSEYLQHLMAKITFLLRELGDTNERLNTIQSLYDALQTESRIMEREHMILRSRLDANIETMEKHAQNYRDAKVAYENQINEQKLHIDQLEKVIGELQASGGAAGKIKIKKFGKDELIGSSGGGGNGAGVGGGGGGGVGVTGSGVEISLGKESSDGSTYKLGSELGTKGEFMQQQIKEWNRQKKQAMDKIKQYEDRIVNLEMEVMDLQNLNEQQKKDLEAANQEPQELRRKHEKQAEAWKLKEEKMLQTIRELTAIKEQYLSLQEAYADIQVQTDLRMAKTQEVCEAKFKELHDIFLQCDRDRVQILNRFTIVEKLLQSALNRLYQLQNLTLTAPSSHTLLSKMRALELAAMKASTTRHGLFRPTPDALFSSEDLTISLTDTARHCTLLSVIDESSGLKTIIPDDVLENAKQDILNEWTSFFNSILNPEKESGAVETAAQTSPESRNADDGLPAKALASIPVLDSDINPPLLGTTPPVGPSQPSSPSKTPSSALSTPSLKPSASKKSIPEAAATALSQQDELVKSDSPTTSIRTGSQAAIRKASIISTSSFVPTSDPLLDDGMPNVGGTDNPSMMASFRWDPDTGQALDSAGAVEPLSMARIPTGLPYRRPNLVDAAIQTKEDDILIGVGQGQPIPEVKQLQAKVRRAQIEVSALRESVAGCVKQMTLFPFMKPAPPNHKEYLAKVDEVEEMDKVVTNCKEQVEKYKNEMEKLTRETKEQIEYLTNAISLLEGLRESDGVYIKEITAELKALHEQLDVVQNELTELITRPRAEIGIQTDKERSLFDSDDEENNLAMSMTMSPTRKKLNLKF